LDSITRLVVSIPIFLLAIIVHEIAHGYVASLFGDDTAKRQGRLTMNPIAHIDPMGILVFFLAGIGWAKPVPVNIALLRPRRLGEVLVSAAGVASNLMQALVWSLLVRALLPHVGASSYVEAALRFCLIGVSVNVLLLAFNLLPIPPLDGFHIITGALGITGSYGVTRLEQAGMLFIVLLAVLGRIGGVSILSRLIGIGYDPILQLLLRGIA